MAQLLLTWVVSSGKSGKLCKLLKIKSLFGIYERTSNIHGTFPFHNRFFRLLKCSSHWENIVNWQVLWGAKNGSFIDIIMKPSFGRFMLVKYTWQANAFFIKKKFEREEESAVCVCYVKDCLMWSINMLCSFYGTFSDRHRETEWVQQRTQTYPFVLWQKCVSLWNAA